MRHAFYKVMQRQWVRWLIASVLLLGIAAPVVAAQSGVDLGVNYATAIGLATSDIRTTIAKVINIFLGLLGLVAVVLILYGGFLWMTARGDDEQVEKAKDTMKNGVIGLIIILSAFAIAQFIFKALGVGSVDDGSGREPPPVCVGASCFGGNGAGFSITAITPVGAGPGGWPKNSAIAVSFNAPVSVGSVSVNSVKLYKCNARTGPYNETECDKTRNLFDPQNPTDPVRGNQLTIRPKTAVGQPAYFDGDFWYKVDLTGGITTPQGPTSLNCPGLVAGDISSPAAVSSLCVRAMAFSDRVDVAAPTVSIVVPINRRYCGATIPIQAVSRDDSAVSRIDFRLTDSSDVDVTSTALTPGSSVSNQNSVYPSYTAFTDPSAPSLITITSSVLGAGRSYTFAGTAVDITGRASTAATVNFIKNPPSCCNGDTSVCGPGCGACDDTSCTDDSQCASGVCRSGRCISPPLISGFSPMNGGPGTFVTISGTFFGATPGNVVFLGGPGDGDDVIAQACAPQAWTPISVRVRVPPGAVSGAIRLVAASRLFDDTTPATLGWQGVFTVNNNVSPGICYLSPTAGAGGSTFSIFGNGFGSQQSTSVINFGTVNPSPAVGGWKGDAQVDVIAPSNLPDGVYPVSLLVAGNPIASNQVNFTLQVPVTGAQISQIIPSSGPVGSYVTLLGTGFGSQKGTVRFISGSNGAVADEPLCSNSWTPTSIVVKVPPRYQNGDALLLSSHNVTVTPAGSVTPGNAMNFSVVTGTPRPGVCSITPNNGPVGTAVTVAGEGFGSGPGNIGAGTRNSLEFFVGGGYRCSLNWSQTCATPGVACTPESAGMCEIPTTVPANSYAQGSWQPLSIASSVPVGPPTPKTGPVFVIAGNAVSSNAVPYIVQDCRQPGVRCAVAGDVCCSDGSCGSASSCPSARDSAYGWKFSTDVLPVLPRVFEDPTCSPGQSPPSPTPFKGTTDVCINSVVYLKFTTLMNTASVTNSSNYLVESCGTGATCVAPFTPVSVAATTTNDSSPARTTLTLKPSSNGSPQDLAQNTWYRVTLKSKPPNTSGMIDTATVGRNLDGDNDGRQGGDYIYTFKTRNSAQPCDFSSVVIDNNPALITNKGAPATLFTAMPIAAGNCNVLQCAPAYTVTWPAPSNNTGVSVPNILSLANVTGQKCQQSVTANEETPVAPQPRPVTLSAQVTSERLSRTGTTAVTVKFADPTVISYFPNCTQACINAGPWATFNVAMESTGANKVDKPNVDIVECRNSGCTPPFVPSSPANFTVKLDAIKTTMTISDMPDLKPNTVYMVRIKGGQNGVKSASGVALSGLNNTFDGQPYFTWKFTTKNDPARCAVSRSAISPATVMLDYIGQKYPLQVTPYGAPDECSAGGQALQANVYNWQWTAPAEARPTGVAAGFLGISGGVISTVAPRATLDLGTPRAMCTAQCVLSGSQSGGVQCGNGVVELGEDCDLGARNGATPGCTINCKWTGNADPNSSVGKDPTCVLSGGGSPSVAPGCSTTGIKTGSSTSPTPVPSSVCGDGVITDGESCDDGNRVSGDGCSQYCLNEGTPPSCLDLPAGPCVNVCGNGRIEPGEACESRGSSATVNCDPQTCRNLGTPRCPQGGGARCCGNGVQDPGEDPTCDPTGGATPAFCTQNCLLRGSSYTYATPSFCGDGISTNPASPASGEVAACEVSRVAPNGNIDPSQIIIGGVPNAAVAGQVNSLTSTVTAVPVVGGVVRSSATSSATVSLSCVCRTQNTQAPQDYCASVATAVAAATGAPLQNLGCDTMGCCSPAPTIVEPYYPRGGSANICRNTVVRVTFSESMSLASVTTNFQVGKKLAVGSACAATPFAVQTDSQPLSGRGFFARAWRAIRSVFGRSANATPTTITNQYCPIPGTISMVGSVLTFSPAVALDADAEYKIVITGGENGAKNLAGVPLANLTNTSTFTTSAIICQIDSVAVLPKTWLFTTAEDLGSAATPDATGTLDATDGDETFVARAQPVGQPPGAQITSTPEYPFTWSWAQQLPTSVIAISPNATPTPANSTAVVTVKNTGAGFPKDGNAVVELTANVTAPGVAQTRFSDTADVTVMICQIPWPARKTCPTNPAGGSPYPWDSAARCTIPGPAWAPFYDPATNVSFYYCRNKTSNPAATLPALNESPTRLAPGRDIVAEYLFTVIPGSGAGVNPDAIGFRINRNLSHVGVAQWYKDKGFAGSPSVISIDGYDALQDGRTAYVNAGVLKANNQLYTNVDTFSYNDGAQAETTAIFNQILGNANLNTNIRDRGYCIDQQKIQVLVGAQAVACDADDDCKKDSAGAYLAANSANTCLNPKTKFTRDVERWANLLAMRSVIMSKKLVGYPQLNAGSFLRAFSASKWPSWAGELTTELRSPLLTDPVNQYGNCQSVCRNITNPAASRTNPLVTCRVNGDCTSQEVCAAFDPKTCWSAQANLYQCPAGSHVYTYNAIGGQSFALGSDFETQCNVYTAQPACDAQQGLCRWSGGACTSAVWDGTTCNEQTTADKCRDIGGSSCQFEAGKCEFVDGALAIGGVGQNSAPICTGQLIGVGGVCGDGVVQGNEECEPGRPARVVTCSVGRRQGTTTQSCNNRCQWNEAAECQTGVCGDGVIQSPEEVCDDGVLNGRYGYCNAACSGQGGQCGDDIKQPNEACDCGANNGAYRFNGILQTPVNASCSGAASAANANSCAWDCLAPAPRCGDNIVNGGEQCDGGAQTSRGVCADPLATPCTATSECPLDSANGPTGRYTCALAPTPEQTYRRSCNPNNVAITTDDAGTPVNTKACNWSAWVLSTLGTCGDGVVQASRGEQCDDGNQIDNDACTIACRLPVCGDNIVNGTDQCDNGAQNNQACTPQYGQSCNYCSASCRVITVSAGYCGDSILQSPSSTPPGTEQCDGTSSMINYICVSSAPRFQSCGLVTSAPTCDQRSCGLACPTGSSLCYNGTGPDSDGDGIRDSCDPDKDNDMVPGTLDCDDKNALIHGNYPVPSTNLIVTQPRPSGWRNRLAQFFVSARRITNESLFANHFVKNPPPPTNLNASPVPPETIFRGFNSTDSAPGQDCLIALRNTQTVSAATEVCANDKDDNCNGAVDDPIPFSVTARGSIPDGFANQRPTFSILYATKSKVAGRPDPPDCSASNTSNCFQVSPTTPPRLSFALTTYPFTICQPDPANTDVVVKIKFTSNNNVTGCQNDPAVSCTRDTERQDCSGNSCSVGVDPDMYVDSVQFGSDDLIRITQSVSIQQPPASVAQPYQFCAVNYLENANPPRTLAGGRVGQCLDNPRLPGCAPPPCDECPFLTSLPSFTGAGNNSGNFCQRAPTGCPVTSPEGVTTRYTNCVGTKNDLSGCGGTPTSYLCLNATQGVQVFSIDNSSRTAGNSCMTDTWTNAIRCPGYFRVSRNSIASVPPPASCGNGNCEVGESNATCPQDCSAGSSVCGDNVCARDERRGSCTQDCILLSAQPVCGDNICSTGESAGTANTCPADCSGGRVPNCRSVTGVEVVSIGCCGDTFCTGSETRANCAYDCSP